MDWTERLGSAVAYIEANLEGDIDLARVARLAGCSAYNFQRLFSYIADKPLSQYIRERRLTLAAFEVVRSDARLIDIALRYGYDSQDAFARAFRQYHGVLPSAVRRESAMLRSCPRIVFHNPTKGDMHMEYKVEKWPAFTIAGYRHTLKTDEAFDVIPGLWEKLWTDGGIQPLLALLRQADYRPEGFLGVAVGGQWGSSDELTYYQAVTTYVDAEGVNRVATPEGMYAFDLPAATWVIIEADGEPKDTVQRLYKQFYAEWLPSSGYKLADLPVVESYMTENRQRIWVAVTQ